MNKIIVILIFLILINISLAYSNVYYLIKTNEDFNFFLNKKEFKNNYIKDIILFLKKTKPYNVSTPIIEPKSGVYYNNLTIKIISQNKVYYTIDGSKPSLKSNLYTSPIYINFNTTIKAIAYDENFHKSDIITQSYTIIGYSNISSTKITEPTTITTKTLTTTVKNTTTKITEPTTITTKTLTTTVKNTTTKITEPTTITTKTLTTTVKNTTTKITEPTTITVFISKENNILPNPSFEKDPYIDYFVYPPVLANYTWDNVFLDGQKSLKIHSEYDGLTRWLSKTDKIVAQPDKKYKATVWIKTHNLKNRAVLALNFWDENLNHLGTKESQSLYGSNEWKKLEVEFNSPLNAKYVRIEFRLYGQGDLWIDNASLIFSDTSFSLTTTAQTSTTEKTTTTTIKTTGLSTITKITTKLSTTTTYSTGRVVIVSPTGSSSGDGSLNKPYDLDTVIGYDRKNNKKISSPLKPGDIVYLRGGLYGKGGNVGFVYKFYVSGSENNYITFRSYPGEKAIINGGIELWGQDLSTGWIIIRDLEITNTDEVRWTDCIGSNNYECYARMAGISIYASHVKIINNYIHDTANGIYTAETSSDLEIYGNIVQNNGWVAPDRAHGHGIYVQNTDQTSKIVKANIVLPGIEDTGIHLFGNSAQAKNVIFEDNIHFTKRWLMVSDEYEINDVIMRNNYLWNSYIKISHSATVGPGFTIENNYIGGAGSSQPEQMFIFNPDLGSFNIKNNVFCFDSTGGKTLIIDSYGYKADSKHILDYNYVCGSYNINYKGSLISYSSWKSQTGFNENQPNTNPRLTNKIIVINNLYEDKKLYVVVYNWETKDVISIDLSDYGFLLGDKYVVRNAMNYNEDQPIIGIYSGGSINIKMKDWTLAYPIGWDKITKYKNMAYRPENPYPLFGIFIISTN